MNRVVVVAVAVMLAALAGCRYEQDLDVLGSGYYEFTIEQDYRTVFANLLTRARECRNDSQPDVAHETEGAIEADKPAAHITRWKVDGWGRRVNWTVDLEDQSGATKMMVHADRVWQRGWVLEVLVPWAKGERHDCRRDFEPLG